MDTIVGVFGRNTRNIHYLVESLEHMDLNQQKPLFLEEYDLTISSNLKYKITESKQFLVIYGDIYSIKNDSKLKVNANNPNELILKLYNYHLQNNNYIDAIKNTMLDLDGDYSFVLYDNDKLILARDSVGLKPLYYGFKDDNFVFASTKKALWYMGIIDVKTLIPGHILIQDKNDIMPCELIFVEDVCNDNNIHYTAHYTYNKLKICLKNNLITATKKRLIHTENVAIIFSGGVDSTLITKIIQNENKNIKLYTVGTKNSKDLEFAKYASKNLNIDLEEIIINKNIIEENLEEVITAIEEFNVMKIGVAMPLHIATKRASEDGFKVAVAGQGADELFGGYTKYLKNYSELGSKTQDVLYNDIRNSYHVNFQRDEAIANNNNISLKAPFMDKSVIQTAMKIPIKYKIKFDDDKIRKHILRDVALDLEVPELIAMRPKKAAQYGSGVHKILIKKILPNFDEIEFMNNLQKPKI